MISSGYAVLSRSVLSNSWRSHELYVACQPPLEEMQKSCESIMVLWGFVNASHEEKGLSNHLLSKAELTPRPMKRRVRPSK